MAEAQVVAQGAPWLVRFVVATHCGTGRNADDAVETDAMFHHYVHDAYGEEDAQSATFKYQSGFHIKCVWGEETSFCFAGGRKGVKIRGGEGSDVPSDSEYIPYHCPKPRGKS